MRLSLGKKSYDYKLCHSWSNASTAVNIQMNGDNVLHSSWVHTAVSWVFCENFALEDLSDETCMKGKKMLLDGDVHVCIGDL